MKNDLNWLYQTPMFQLQDRIIGWWHEQLILSFIKMYYFPFFVAGNADNVADLFKPQTYGICRS